MSGATWNGDAPGRAVAAERIERDVVRLECPECGEDAIEQPPDTAAPGQDVPRYAHPDGEPLCPVTGPSRYGPSPPREVLADPLDDETTRRAQLARWHADDHGTESGTGEGIDR